MAGSIGNRNFWNSREETVAKQNANIQRYRACRDSLISNGAFFTLPSIHRECPVQIHCRFHKSRSLNFPENPMKIIVQSYS